ncbi:hypothetical protein LguiB_032490 [Lonicera macranthoides]
MVRSRSRSRSKKMSSSHCGCYNYDEKSPQFFKIYAPHHSSQSLRIPPAFIKYLKGNLPSKSILRTPAKRSWRIDMKKIDNYIFFQKGWPEFVRDNSLVFGDFLVFCYTGNLEFYVTIFGKNNCQKEIPITTRDSDDPQPLLQRNRTVGPSELGSVEIGTTRMLVRDNIGALETPSTLGTKKPFFESVLKPTYVRTGSMHIPSEFRNSYMSTYRKTARLMHMSKSWLVQLSSRGNRLVFSTGWSKFVADNTLREGNVCSFELIQSDDYAFNVAILRGNGTPDKAQGTKTTQPSSSREEDSEEMGTTCMLVRNNNGALETPCELGTKKPLFESVMKSTYVHGTYMYIPSKFVESYMSTYRQTARLTHSNKSWLVKLLRRRNILIFACGWRQFVEDNTLSVGDACRFELIHRNDYTFDVVILRGNGTPPDKVQGTKTTRPSSSRKEGNSKEIGGLEDAFDKFTSEHPFFHVVLSPAYVGWHLALGALEVACRLVSARQLLKQEGPHQRDALPLRQILCEGQVPQAVSVQDHILYILRE